LQALTAMKDEGFLAEVSPDLLNAQQAVVENEGSIADFTAKLQQVEGQLRQLDTDLTSLQRDSLESATARKNQMGEVLSRITMAKLDLERNSDILSEYSGRILEVLAAPGQVLSSGARLARLELDDEEQSLVAVGYFQVGDGKKIKQGMSVQITPDAVE